MNNHFAKNLKYLRKARHIDQQVMADDLGVAQSTLSCWETGIRTPDLDMIVKINKYLNIQDDFITKDLTIPNESNQLETLVHNNIDILTDNDKEQIKLIIEKRKNEIVKQSSNK